MSIRTRVIVGGIALGVITATVVGAYWAAAWAVSFLSWPGVITLLAVQAGVGVGAALDWHEARLEPPTRFHAWLVAHYTAPRRVYRRARWSYDGVRARRRAAAARAVGVSPAVLDDAQRDAA